jgi:hypothetical protein
MRTTLTLDPDVARMLQDEVHRRRRPLKEVVNDALRQALTRSRGPLKRYRVHTHAARLRPGFDTARLNALADEMEDSALLGRGSRRSSPM